MLPKLGVIILVPKHYELLRIHPVRPLVNLSQQTERDVPKWTCAVSTKVYIRLTFTFLAETRKRLLLRCRHKCYLAPVGFHHYILLVSVAHASSAGDMMAVLQTPLSRFATQYSCECGTIIYCSVATIPLSGPYSCVYASFSLDTAGTASLAGGATLHYHAIACVNG